MKVSKSTSNQKEKAKFRRSSRWKRFRIRIRKERQVDAVTQYPLRNGWSLHHMDLNADHYADISDETHFECLNRQTHDVIHFLYRYYKNDRGVLNRLEQILEKMKVINET